MAKQSTQAEIVGKVVSLPMKFFNDDDKNNRFEELLSTEILKHPDCQSFGPALGARAEYHIEFATSEGDQVLTDFVNRCRRTALRRLHGNKNRQERRQDDHGGQGCTSG